MVDLDDRAANDPENPPSTKGTRGRGSSPHAGTADTRSKRDLATPIDLTPTMMGEESMNSSPTKGWNKFSRPSPAGHSTKSDRFTK